MSHAGGRHFTILYVLPMLHASRAQLHAWAAPLSDSREREARGPWASMQVVQRVGKAIAAVPLLVDHDSATPTCRVWLPEFRLAKDSDLFEGNVPPQLLEESTLTTPQVRCCYVALVPMHRLVYLPGTSSCCAELPVSAASRDTVVLLHAVLSSWLVGPSTATRCTPPSAGL